LGWGGSGGKKYWMRSHNASVSSGLAIFKTSRQPGIRSRETISYWRFYRTNRSPLIRFC
jgi:hypothetical protein